MMRNFLPSSDVSYGEAYLLNSAFESDVSHGAAYLLNSAFESFNF